MKQLALMGAVVACTLAGCAAQDDDPVMNIPTTNIPSLTNMDVYDDLPAMNAAEAQRILALFRNPELVHEHLDVEETATADGTLYRVTVTCTVEGGYGLSLSLRILQDTVGNRYYLGYETTDTHEAMAWTVKGFSLSSGEAADCFDFAATGTTWLKTYGTESTLLSTPMTLKGTYDARNQKASLCINMLNSTEF